MTLPEDVLKDLTAFKTKLPTVVRKKRVKREGPTVQPEPKPAPKETVRKNGPRSWLVMIPTEAAHRGLKSREDPVVRDAPITKAPRSVSHMDGNTARICNDARLFKGKK